MEYYLLAQGKFEVQEVESGRRCRPSTHPENHWPEREFNSKSTALLGTEPRRQVASKTTRCNSGGLKPKEPPHLNDGPGLQISCLSLQSDDYLIKDRRNHY